MTNKKDLIIVVLATFCLTATLFLITPTRSQQPSEYDPWIDNNEDGTVDILDAIKLADVFGTSGDPTKNVNVTNPRYKLLQKDLNITITGHVGYAEYAFETEGFESFDLALAITDISDRSYPEGYATVGVQSANWLWDIDNSSLIETSSYPIMRNYSYPERPAYYQFSVSVSPSSTLPTSSEASAEFEVMGTQCSLPFAAQSSFQDGWVSVHAWVCLMVSKISAPAVQQTWVTNWPSAHLYESYNLHFITSIYQGTVWTSQGLYIGGYSRMYITSLVVTNASYHDILAKTTISLIDIGWNGGWESVAPGTLNVTYYGTSLPTYSYQVPTEFKTRNSFCTLEFTVSSEALAGNWIEWYATVYLRNE